MRRLLLAGALVVSLTLAGWIGLNGGEASSGTKAPAKSVPVIELVRSTGPGQSGERFRTVGEKSRSQHARMHDGRCSKSAPNIEL